MAEPGSFLNALWQLATPRSAEAKVIGSPEAMQTLQAAQQQPGPYAEVIRAAQAVPETVELIPAPGLAQGSPPRWGEYEPLMKSILYESQRPPADVHRTLVHELLHFLAQRQRQPADMAKQHQVIYDLLGGRGGGPGQPQPGSAPVPLSPADQAVYQQWLQTRPRGRRR